MNTSFIRTDNPVFLSFSDLHANATHTWTLLLPLVISNFLIEVDHDLKGFWLISIGTLPLNIESVALALLNLE